MQLQPLLRGERSLSLPRGGQPRYTTACRHSQQCDSMKPPRPSTWTRCPTRKRGETSTSTERCVTTDRTTKKVRGYAPDRSSSYLRGDHCVVAVPAGKPVGDGTSESNTVLTVWSALSWRWTWTSAPGLGHRSSRDFRTAPVRYTSDGERRSRLRDVGDAGMTKQLSAQTRLERVLGVPLAENAVRQWPQGGEVVRDADASRRWSRTLSCFGWPSVGGTIWATPSWSSGAPTTVTGGSTEMCRSPSSREGPRSA